MVESTWSMPKRGGPGRSIKVEVCDGQLGVIGWLELASAPLAMKERDDTYPGLDPGERVDLRTVGAHPAYAPWRAASLVGLMGLTDDVLRLWERKYRQPVKLVQTTGAFGVSAVYHRKRAPTIGRGWARCGYTAGAYPVVSEKLVYLAQEVTGSTRSLRQDMDVIGLDNQRKAAFQSALIATGRPRPDVKRIMASLGIKRAVYTCPVTAVGNEHHARAVYSDWRRLYARRPTFKVAA